MIVTLCISVTFWYSWNSGQIKEMIFYTWLTIFCPWRGTTKKCKYSHNSLSCILDKNIGHIHNENLSFSIRFPLYFFIFFTLKTPLNEDFRSYFFFRIASLGTSASGVVSVFLAHDNCAVFQKSNRSKAEDIHKCKYYFSQFILGLWRFSELVRT